MYLFQSKSAINYDTLWFDITKETFLTNSSSNRSLCSRSHSRSVFTDTFYETARNFLGVFDLSEKQSGEVYPNTKIPNATKQIDYFIQNFPQFLRRPKQAQPGN